MIAGMWEMAECATLVHDLQNQLLLHPQAAEEVVELL